jgi:outer membrane protein assembly factor BamB
MYRFVQKQSSMLRFLLTATFISLLIFQPAIAQDWPDWRGLNRDGIWSGSEGKMEGLKTRKIWVQPIGSGYSGPIVAGGKVFITDLQDNPQTEGVICFDEKTGEKVWEFRYECPYEGIGYPAGPRASVVYNNGLVWSLGTMGHLYCFDAQTGTVKWQHDLNKKYSIRMPIWGIAATPLIHEEKLILHIGGSDNACVVALEKNTGKELWRNLGDAASYSAPVIFQKNGNNVLVVWTEDNLAGLNPANGEVHWKIPWKMKMGMAISTPVLSNDYLFVSSFYNGSLLVQLTNNYTAATKIWQRSGANERNTDALHCVMNTPVIIGKYIYGIDSYGELRCLELLSGNRVWEDNSVVDKERWANVHFVQNSNKVLMFNEHGELLVTELSPEGVRIISREKIIEPTKKQLPRGVTWAHPAFANGHVFIRNDHEIKTLQLEEL